jgi:hypothetical protein
MLLLHIFYQFAPEGGSVFVFLCCFTLLFSSYPAKIHVSGALITILAENASESHTLQGIDVGIHLKYHLKMWGKKDLSSG